MSISVDIYRARIGLFSSNMVLRQRRHKTKNVQPTRCSSGIIIFKVAVMTMILLVVLSNISHVSGSYVRRSLKNENPTNIFSQKPFKRNSNFLARYTFGNRRHFGIKLCHWNDGSSHLVNKVNEIENVISSYKPHVFGISETSFHKSQTDLKFDNYQVVYAKTLSNPNLNVSRVSVLVHDDIQFKIRK